MRKINPKCLDYDSFKYSISISLHYYHIPLHCETISKLLPYEKLYDFISLIPSEFEGNDNNISLDIYDKKLLLIYRSKNNSPKVANITQIGNRNSTLEIQKVHMINNATK